MPDFPTAIPTDIPDSVDTETLFSMHGGIGHVPATNRILTNIKALATKLGIANGTGPPGSGAVLRRTATSQSGWGPVQAGDMVGGGTANRVLRTQDGTVAAWSQLQSGDYGASSIGTQEIAPTTVTAAKLNAGGTANRALTTTDGANAAWAQVLAAMIATGPAGSVLAGGASNNAFLGSVPLSGSLTVAGSATVGPVSAGATGEIRSSAAIFPSTQGIGFFSVPVASISIAPTGGTLQIGTNSRLGLLIAIDHSSADVAIFQLRGLVNVTALLAGNSGIWATSYAADHMAVAYTSGIYIFHNGFTSAHFVTGIFLGT